MVNLLASAPIIGCRWLPAVFYFKIMHSMEMMERRTFDEVAEMFVGPKVFRDICIGSNITVGG